MEGLDADYESSNTEIKLDDQKLVPLPISQIGFTCVLTAIAYLAQMELRRKSFMAGQKSYITFDVEYFEHLYTRETMVEILFDCSPRIQRALRMFMDFGVLALSKFHSAKCMRLRGFMSFPPTIHPETGKLVDGLTFPNVIDIMKHKMGLIGSFPTEKTFGILGTDEIYDFTPVPGTQYDTHCVLFVDYGVREQRPYLKFLNSAGPEFGKGGFGLVYFKSIIQINSEFCFHMLTFDEPSRQFFPVYPRGSTLPPPPLYSATANPRLCPASGSSSSRRWIASDHSSLIILKITEMEPILEVMRFIQELVVADREPTVAEAKVASLCLNVNQHISAGRWLDIALLIMESIQFLLIRGVTDEALECILIMTCNLVTKATSEDEGMKIVELMCGKLTQLLDHKPSLALRILFGLYNMVVAPYGKAFIYSKVLEFAVASNSTEIMIPSLQNIDAYISDWGIDTVEQRKLFLNAGMILKDTNGMNKLYFDFLNKYLGTFNGSDDDPGLNDAKEIFVLAVIVFVKSSDVYQCDLLHFPIVALLEKDEKYKPFYDLLEIFLTQRLHTYVKFYTDNSGLLKRYGLVHEECVSKMRLMSLLDLSTHSSGEITYSAIREALEIEVDDVEFWIVKAISCKIMDCKIDQINQTILVSQHTERNFGVQQWQSLREKIRNLRGNIASAIRAIECNKVA